MRYFHRVVSKDSEDPLDNAPDIQSDALASTCVRPDTEEHLKSLGAGKP